MVQASTVIDLHHWKSLTEESGISPEVIEERGYYTATDPDELVALGFESYQACVPALVIPLWGVDGELRFHRIRPDRPRPGKKPGKVVKYEQPAHVPPALDVPRRCQPYLTDTSRRLFVVEGEKKADALASRGEVALAILGVWSWKRDGMLLPDWDQVWTVGREILIGFDSDSDRYEIQQAQQALALALEGRTGDAR